MTTRPLREAKTSIDKDGRGIILVPLANTTKHAKLFIEDWQQLLADGFSPNLCFNLGMVKISDWRRRTPRLSRILVKAGPGYMVRHRDGDPLNCRRDNIVLIKTHTATHRAPQGLPQSP
jgi:hypothetical protein